MFEELLEMQNVICEIMEKTNKFGRATMLAGFMMLMEEWCRANHENMVETFEELNETCKAVNAELGAYV